MPSLDGIRGIAIAAVVGFHYYHRPSAGFIGVDLFFVLSGFLITTLLLEERAETGKVSLRSFYIRRARRLTPPLWMLMVIVIGTGTSWLSLAALTYVTNIVGAVKPIHGALSPLWSLAEEEQFYLLWPLCLLALLRRRLPAVRILATLVAVGACYRVLMIVAGAPLHRVYFAPDTHADPIIVGCLIALLRAAGLRLRSKLAGGIAVAVFVATAFAFAGTDSPYSLALALPLAEISGAIIVLAALEVSPTASLLAVRPLVWLGQISYSLYLWHPFVHQYEPPTTRGSLIATPIALLLAWLSYQFIEKPFRVRRTAPAIKPSTHESPHPAEAVA